jgi:ubiquinone/menaquinone biosynthesis C-methylase UbiE
MNSSLATAPAAPSDWWKSFFSGLFVDMWSSAMPVELTLAEADFLERALRLLSGTRVLDVACGHGRLAVELAARGCEVTGVDISEEFLDRARGAAADRGVSVDFVHGDMQRLAFRGAFDAVYCMGSSFGFFDDAGNQAALDGAARALRPGGRFALGTGWLAESLLARFHEQLHMEISDITFEARNRWIPATGRAENLFTVRRGERSETRAASHRVYTYRELATMLERAGFVEIEASGSPAGEPIALGSPGALVVATIRS